MHRSKWNPNRTPDAIIKSPISEISALLILRFSLEPLALGCEKPFFIPKRLIDLSFVRDLLPNASDGLRTVFLPRVRIESWTGVCCKLFCDSPLSNGDAGLFLSMAASVISPRSSLNFEFICESSSILERIDRSSIVSSVGRVNGSFTIGRSLTPSLAIDTIVTWNEINNKPAKIHRRWSHRTLHTL